ncbi:Fungal specific transcription factor [Neofusicoccum parvum]|uniref:Fungal specific transcription factor n=1 Tax=Neofusicoccum parvum TaxID=310453 RepID=A0ACB5RV90_9PEZI|nr:Fungal specific transcription factor [Neofusicoccum parvum]
MSPATVSTGSLSTPPERPDAPFGYISPQAKVDFNMTNDHQTNFNIYQSPQQPNLQSTQSTPTNSIHMTADMSSPSSMTNISSPGFDQQMQYNPVPVTFADLPAWSPSFPTAQAPDTFGQPGSQQQYPNSMGDYSSTPFATAVGALYEDYLANEQPGWSVERPGMGLNQAQQFELLESLQTHGPEQIESMIEESNALFAPSSRAY